MTKYLSSEPFSSSPSSQAYRDGWERIFGKKELEPKREELKPDDPRILPDWNTPCASCGAKPTMPLTGLCGPCTTGEAETSGGNW
jgi:hypothetical protein